MPVYEISCQECGKTVSVYRNSAQVPPRFCSIACKAKAQQGQAWGRGKENGHTPWNKGQQGIPNPTAQRIPRDRDLLHRLYWTNGLTTVEIAERYGVSFAAVAKVMRDLAIPKRTFEEAAKLKMSQRTPEERKANIMNAQASQRGKPKPDSVRQKRAQTVQQQAKLSEHEQKVFQLLENAGYHPVPLFAVDKFNIDIAFPDLLLGFEITSGGWHHTERKRQADSIKFDALRALGWNIVDLNRQRMSPIDAYTAIVNCLP